MEHRHGRRLAVQWDTLITIANGAPLRGRTRNFSMGGLFVELPPHTLKLDNCVTVSTVIEAGDGMRIERWSAQVVHRRQCGVGLMFSELSPSRLDRLGELEGITVPQPARAPRHSNSA